MKKIMMASVVAAAVAVGGVAMAASSLKVGVVDYQKVFQQAPQGNATLNKLKAELKPKLAKLKAQQMALEASVKKLERNSSTMTKAQRKAAQEKLATDQKDFQKGVMTARGSEMKKERAAASNFESALKAAINKVAHADHLDMVLNKQATPYVNAKLDVTAAVVADMESKK